MVRVMTHLSVHPTADIHRYFRIRFLLMNLFHNLVVINGTSVFHSTLVCTVLLDLYCLLDRRKLLKCIKVLIFGLMVDTYVEYFII